MCRDTPNTHIHSVNFSSLVQGQDTWAREELSTSSDINKYTKCFFCFFFSTSRFSSITAPMVWFVLGLVWPHATREPPPHAPPALALQASGPSCDSTWWSGCHQKGPTVNAWCSSWGPFNELSWRPELRVCRFCKVQYVFLDLTLCALLTSFLLPWCCWGFSDLQSKMSLHY